MHGAQTARKTLSALTRQTAYKNEIFLYCGDTLLQMYAFRRIEQLLGRPSDKVVSLSTATEGPAHVTEKSITKVIEKRHTQFYP